MLECWLDPHGEEGPRALTAGHMLYHLPSVTKVPTTGSKDRAGGKDYPQGGHRQPGGQTSVQLLGLQGGAGGGEWPGSWGS